MILVMGIVVEFLGNPTPKIKVVSRDGPPFYYALNWPPGKPLNKGTLKVEIARHWEVPPGEVIIAEHIKIPKV